MHKRKLILNAKTCMCVEEHQPSPQVLHHHHILPKEWGGPTRPENLIWICPTTHNNVHVLLNHYVAYKGRVPTSVRKHFGSFTQQLAALGWQRHIHSAKRRERSGHRVPWYPGKNE